MRTTILGLLLAATLVLAFPVSAEEKVFYGWSSFDLFSWVIELWDSLSSEVTAAEVGPGYDPGSAAEMGPEADPGG